MVPAPTVTILIDLPPGQRFRAATMGAVDHAASALGVAPRVRIVPTGAIGPDLVRDPGRAVVVGPGSPYRNPEGVHQVVRTARERGLPLVGT